MEACSSAARECLAITVTVRRKTTWRDTPRKEAAGATSKKQISIHASKREKKDISLISPLPLLLLAWCISHDLEARALEGCKIAPSPMRDGGCAWKCRGPDYTKGKKKRARYRDVSLSNWKIGVIFLGSKKEGTLLILFSDDFEEEVLVMLWAKGKYQTKKKSLALIWCFCPTGSWLNLLNPIHFRWP